MSSTRAGASEKVTRLEFFLAGVPRSNEGTCSVEAARWLNRVLRAVGVMGLTVLEVQSGRGTEAATGMMSCGTQGLLAVGTASDSLGRAAERTACMVAVWLRVEDGCGGCFFVFGMVWKENGKPEQVYIMDEGEGERQRVATEVEADGKAVDSES